MINTKSLIVYIEKDNKVKTLSVNNYGGIFDLGVSLKNYDGNIKLLSESQFEKYNIVELFDVDLLNLKNNLKYDVVYFLNEEGVKVDNVDLLESIERESLFLLFSRYKKFINDYKTPLSLSHIPDDAKYTSLIRLVEEAIENGDDYPTDKLHRWLGFTQGALTAFGILNVNEERNFSRPLLHLFHINKVKSF